jgi:RNA polymerase sigma-70 factor, ECF subfamily
LAEPDLHTFEQLFKQLFKPLTAYAVKYIQDVDDAKNIVHDVFIVFWEKRTSLTDISLKSYLYTAVRNRCLNYIRDKKKHVSVEHMQNNEPYSDNSVLEALELEARIDKAIQSLPEKCREIFELNRFEGLRYAQIAEKLNLSVKTVEAQMSKALSVLRENLSEFLTIIFLLMST